MKTQRNVFDENDMKTYSCRRSLKLSVHTQKCNPTGKRKLALSKFVFYEARKHVGAHADKETKHKNIVE